MKKLGLKLGLSCAALAACATTLVSTTFAWYTSNDTVEASGLVANTETGGSDSLQISSDGTSWGTKVDLSTVINTDAKKTLKPVERTANASGVGTFKLQNGEGTTNPVSSTAATSTTGVIQFNLYFRNVASSSSNVYLKTASYSNTTATLPTTKLIADLTASYTTAANTAYTVDLMRVLDVEIEVETATVGESDPVVLAKAGDFSFGKVNAYNMESESYSDTLSAQTDWDALNYYNAVKGLTSDNAATRDESIVDPSASLESIAGTANGLFAATTPTTIVKTTWTIYEDGWDKACYDAVKGQTFSLDLTFCTAIA